MHQQCTAARLQCLNPPGRCYHILAVLVLQRCLIIVYEVVLHYLSSQPPTPHGLPFGKLLVSEGEGKLSKVQW